ncbi:MAG: Ig-like domain-containing protein, partial [Propionibacteriaceae bacterium]|nr:Ig-like domain-containing protein [Propionibacteriaceae bacterium]
VAYGANTGSGFVPPTRNTADDPDYQITLSSADTLAKAGYALAGWNTAPDGSGQAYALGAQFDLSTANGYAGSGDDVTLYAQWVGADTQLKRIGGQPVAPSGGSGTAADPYQAEVNGTAAALTPEDFTAAGAQIAIDTSAAFGSLPSVALAPGATTAVFVKVTAASGANGYYLVRYTRPVDTTGLSGLLASIDTLRAHGAFKAYSQASVATLDDALAQARQLLAGTPTQPQVDAAKSAVLSALAALDVTAPSPSPTPEPTPTPSPTSPPGPNPDPAAAADATALKAELKAAQHIAADGYTAKSFKVLQGELDDAAKVLAKAGATQSDFDTACAQLIAAVDSLAPHYTKALRVQVAKVRVAKGKKFQLGAIAYLTDGAKGALAFKSSKPKVAQVDAKGKIRARAAGKAVITVSAKTKSRKGKTVVAKVAVQVVKRPKSVAKVSAKAPKKLAVGKQAVVKAVWNAKATPAKVVFHSSKPAIATIDAAGVLTARKPGTAHVKVTAGGKSRSYKVKVVKK